MTVKIYNKPMESLDTVFERGPGPEDQWPQAFYQRFAAQIDGTNWYTFPAKK